MTDESDMFAATFKYKIPFLILGVAIGMAIVWVALQWAPSAIVNALEAVGVRTQ